MTRLNKKKDSVRRADGLRAIYNQILLSCQLCFEVDLEKSTLAPKYEFLMLLFGVCRIFYHSLSRIVVCDSLYDSLTDLAYFHLLYCGSMVLS